MKPPQRSPGGHVPAQESPRRPHGWSVVDVVGVGAWVLVVVGGGNDVDVLGGS